MGTAVLDAYAQGRHDEALAPVRQATRDSAREFRQQMVFRAAQRVDAVPADRSRRALAAASFALEFERIRAERGEWHADGEKDCAGRCVIEWACALVQSRGVRDEGERGWLLATIALANGVRDWAFLQTPLAAPSDRTVQTGHVHHALARFPDDPRFRLARAVALASRNAVTDERGAPREGSLTEPAPAVVIGPAFLNSMALRNRSRLGDYVRTELEALASDEVVGSEARVRLGYLHWVRGDEREALTVESAAADGAKDPDVRYVAHFLAAQAAQALADLPAAAARYRAALAVRPNSQSATLALAALLYLRGEAKDAYDLVAASRTNLPRDDDPWRMFLYGDYPNCRGSSPRSGGGSRHDPCWRGCDRADRGERVVRRPRPSAAAGGEERQPRPRESHGERLQADRQRCRTEDRGRLDRIRVRRCVAVSRHERKHLGEARRPEARRAGHRPDAASWRSLPAPDDRRLGGRAGPLGASRHRREPVLQRGRRDLPGARRAGRGGAPSARSGSSSPGGGDDFGSSVLRAFRTIFDEFRQSYVLRYSPSGVKRGGWHGIAVQVPSMSGVTIRARHGYFD